MLHSLTKTSRGLNTFEKQCRNLIVLPNLILLVYSTAIQRTWTGDIIFRKEMTKHASKDCSREYQIALSLNITKILRLQFDIISHWREITRGFLQIKVHSHSKVWQSHILLWFFIKKINIQKCFCILFQISCIKINLILVVIVGMMVCVPLGRVGLDGVALTDIKWVMGDVGHVLPVKCFICGRNVLVPKPNTNVTFTKTN